MGEEVMIMGNALKFDVTKDKLSRFGKDRRVGPAFVTFGEVMVR